MKQEVRLGLGPIKASLAAGPIFGLSLMLTNYVNDIPKAVPLYANDALPFFGLSIGFLIGGLIISIFPNVIGALILGSVCEQNPVFRIPIVWAGIGAAAIAVPALAIYVGGGGFAPDTAQLTIALVMTGAACATICRRSARWIGISTPVAVTHMPSPR